MGDVLAGLVLVAVSAVLIEAMLPNGSMKRSAEKLIALASAAEILALIIVPLINYLSR